MNAIWPAKDAEGLLMGGKGAALSKLKAAGFSVPNFFAIPADVIAACEAHGTPAWFASALRQLCHNGERLAVRSSSIEEDGSSDSFAGQYMSFLNVPQEEAWGRVLDVWKSGGSERVAEYRRLRGRAGPAVAPAVIVQLMVPADRAGVAFSCDPVSGRRDVCVITSVSGLGDRLVSGECDGETWCVTADEAVGPESGVLQSGNAVEIRRLAVRAERFFGAPQDIEWAMENGRLHLVQSRPITALPDRERREIWDNSNIGESYHGVTTPLTFTFARRAYEEVYRQFCRVLRVPSRRIRENSRVFANMLGLVRGRIYYNLLNWYRVLAMLPGFRVNRTFMEQMMGVKEPLPTELVEEIGTVGASQRLRDMLDACRSLAALGVAYVTLPRSIQRFQERFNRALDGKGPRFEEMSLADMAVYFHDLDRQLLTRWDAPLINDFFAMIFHGLLRRLTAKWCGEEGALLCNRLLAEQGGMISAEPAKRIRQMALVAREHPELVRQLVAGEVEEFRRALEAHPEFHRLYDEYLDGFGDRCLNELKLESPTLSEDPLPLMRSVGSLASVRLPVARPIAVATTGGAEHDLDLLLGGRPLRRLMLGWILKNARRLVRNRENLRFERTRLFGRARRLFRCMGERLKARGLLDDSSDVFFLEVGELLGVIEGTATCADLRGLAAVRKAEFEKHKAEVPPPGRFETRGPVSLERVAVVHETPRGVTRPAAGPMLRGTGGSPGVVEAEACVVTDPRASLLKPGGVLVARRVDPGWIVLFPLASALVLEHGSLLSHAAIVAREMGIPAVFGVPQACDRLASGSRVRVDGGRGEIHILEER